MRKKASLGRLYEESGKRNGLNFLRLVLAIMVIFQHSIYIGDFNVRELQVFSVFGTWAVGGFFAISGYLISSSWMSEQIVPRYMMRRFFRVFPAFWVALLVVGFFAVPIYLIIGGRSLDEWAIADSWAYFLSNFGLFIFQHGIGDSLAGAAYSESWNGSLWTLAPEFICYVGIVLYYKTLPPRFKSTALALLILVFSLSSLVLGVPYLIQEAIRLLIFFLAGAYLFCLRDRLFVNGWLIFLSLTVIASVWLEPRLMVLAAVPCAYTLMSMGLIIKRPKFTQTTDLSYGVYIYAFPVQQFVAVLFPQLNFFEFCLTTVALTMPLASLSWFLVERPALLLGKVLLRK